VVGENGNGIGIGRTNEGGKVAEEVENEKGVRRFGLGRDARCEMDEPRSDQSATRLGPRILTD
jgi:hypothetical protein